MLDLALAEGDPVLADREVDREFVVNPRRDCIGCDAETEGVPAAEVELLAKGGFVHRRVGAVNAGKTHDLASPATRNPCAIRVAHGKGDAGEETAAADSRRLDADLIPGNRKRQRGAGPGDSGQGAGADRDDAILNCDFAG